jgi:hypothetical protein
LPTYDRRRQPLILWGSERRIYYAYRITYSCKSSRGHFPLNSNLGHLAVDCFMYIEVLYGFIYLKWSCLTVRARGEGFALDAGAPH